MSRGRGYLGILCLAWLLTGCTAWKVTKKVGEVVMNPDVPVGKASDQPSTVTLALLAEPDINPNESGEATPTEIVVIYLSEDSLLLAADYDPLSNDQLEKTLGKNYLDHQQYTLLPDQFKPLPPIELEKNTRFLGVIARYADASRSEWKKIIKIKGQGHHYQVLIHIRSHEIELRKEGE
ncbi:type VI secretion system lipoprotein TssJ [Erwinia sorbitola]|uniref:Type VI secretion system lipoprotein TssJ n=1 Tax=Erwinia sorbitola TaxID=2681984 RepID=A0A6I6EPE7_9GAMM|nr:type VI secretion system lipoprotein TssJ [Erwinia sorbitola]QGU88116.1 type VI secretion system lipoprotein TssJ [Erwinia sorbitola]